MISGMGSYLSHGEPVCVETDDDRYLGTAEIVGDVVVVRTGRVGRPFRIPIEQIVRVSAPDDGDT
ncbi:MAG: hypothetical protein JWN77_2636 [Frankiales bacterium]|jgi:hypothetical protein|nr:hypothetical protein [Frankiales bacterium]